MRDRDDIAADLERRSEQMAGVMGNLMREAAAALRAQKPLVVTDAIVERFNAVYLAPFDCEHDGSPHGTECNCIDKAALTAALTSDNEAGQ